MNVLALGEPTGQGWPQIGELGAALVLCSLIGLERQLRQKSAGLRTHTLVGVGSALFMLISKYGFTDVLVRGEIVLDPSRVAAQIVSGIGFVGGGLIFVRRDVVRGLTTAAVVWVAAAVGAACGAGLPVLAAVVTAGHFVVAYGYPPLLRLIGGNQAVYAGIRVRYADGQGVLRDVLHTATHRGFAVHDVSTETSGDAIVELVMRLSGREPADNLVTALAELDGVRSVGMLEPDE
ncbi:MAG TPA: MgtC/SapB family protein [Pseudonocardiaceae bacterium]|jgi:putative Mg2+ transporter-C (MgtC) family protein|nr:MgtC/SapB family protein [Pseudonocardiaceae bacterium]